VSSFTLPPGSSCLLYAKQSCRVTFVSSGINRPDVLQRKGSYNPPPGASDLPGLEVAGTIVGGDPDAMAAMNFALGDSVCALANGGGYAQVRVSRFIRHIHSRAISPRPVCQHRCHAVSANTQRLLHDPGCISAGNVLHGLGQRIRAGTAAAR
jgi:hypothetical protein